MRLDQMTFENWLAIMGGLLAIVASLNAMQERRIKQTIKADVSGPLATLDANHRSLCDKLDTASADHTARAEMHARRLDEMQLDTRKISERVTAIEEWRRVAQFDRRSARG